MSISNVVLQVQYASIFLASRRIRAKHQERSESKVQHMLETFHNDPFHKLREGTLPSEVFKFFASVWPSNIVNFY